MEENNQYQELKELTTVLLKKLMAEKMKNFDFEIPVSQVIVLRILFAKGQQKASELAKVLGISKSAVTSLSDAMILSGFITREFSDNDRRVVLLRITDSGKEKLEQILHKHEERLDKVFSDLNDEEISHLKSIMSKVLKNLDVYF